MIDCILQYVEGKPTATLKEMKSHVTHMLPEKPIVSEKTISRHLDGQMISLKLVRTAPMQWNEPRIKLERMRFMEWFMADGVNQNLVYCDEFGANIWTARTKGRGPVGQRAVRIVEDQRGANLTICLAVSPRHGYIHHNIVEGGFTQERFSDFLNELDTILPENRLLLLDNARPHLNYAGISDNHEFRYLPKYSPFLNMTEMAGSCLKVAVKRRLSELAVQ